MTAQFVAHEDSLRMSLCVSPARPNVGCDSSLLLTRDKVEWARGLMGVQGGRGGVLALTDNHAWLARALSHPPVYVTINHSTSDHLTTHTHKIKKNRKISS